MSESAETASTSRDTLLNGGVHLGSSPDNPTKRDPTTNDASQILLDALQNFVVPLIDAANGKNTKNINEAQLRLEAGRLLTALQDFISSVIIQSRVGPQGIEVDLEDDAQAESRDVVRISAVANPRPLEDVTLSTMYRSLMGKIPEAVRKHVFGEMPIRVLHFTNTPRDFGTKLQITLLDRNGVCSRVIEKIQANCSEGTFGERVEFYRRRRRNNRDNQQTIEDAILRELVRENTRYAILSHTWLRGSDSEVTYGDWQIGRFDTQRPGYQKLVNFCKSAWKDHGFSFGWTDTICINKDSSSELDESIRSMYKWYTGSGICITYLAETVALGDIHRDPWFTRGWTFQELLAPAHMSFYNKDWKNFIRYTYPGDKSDPDILQQIYTATTITEGELRNPTWLPISRKMQLAASRKVMREEDIAYSLMGICNVSISIAYGEGARRAFFRLMTEILHASSEVFAMFNCAQTGHSIIPSGPSAYLNCSKDIMNMLPFPPIEPLLLTHVGLRTPILLMPSLQEDDPCFENNSIGDYHAMSHLPALDPWETTGSGSLYRLLDKGITTSTSDNRRVFGILNFGGDTTSIVVPEMCLALCFMSLRREWDSTSSGIQPIRTKGPIVFPLLNRKRSSLRAIDKCYSLKRSELTMHGMTLITMYL